MGCLVKSDLGASGLDDATGPGTTETTSAEFKFEELHSGSPSGSTTSAATASSSVTTETTTATATSTASAAVATEATTATTSATATTTETTTTTAAALAIRLGSGVVETETTAIEVVSLESLDGGLGLVDGSELDVAKALGRTGLAVGDEVDALDVTVLAKELVQGV